MLRSEFDHMMLNNAREHGVDVHEESRVLDVTFDGDRQTGIRVQYKDGREETLHPKVIVDASGQSSIISNRLKLKNWEPKLKKAAVWSYFKGAKREPGALMNSVARRLFNRVRNPFTRERKYQTRLGSSNSAEANCMFDCSDARDC